MNKLNRTLFYFYLSVRRWSIKMRPNDTYLKWTNTKGMLAWELEEDRSLNFHVHWDCKYMERHFNETQVLAGCDRSMSSYGTERIVSPYPQSLDMFVRPSETQELGNLEWLLNIRWTKSDKAIDRRGNERYFHKGGNIEGRDDDEDRLILRNRRGGPQ